MANTSNIMDLPMDPTGGTNTNNIHLATSEAESFSNTNLDQTTIHQIVSGLQQASTTGATSLPSRDIPRTTVPLTQDPYIQPNYIPDTKQTDYIEEEQSQEEMIHHYHSTKHTDDSLDSLYTEIQIPLLLAVLYFIFQMPIFKITLFKNLPVLFNKDGNFNLYGLVFTSALYGGIYYCFSKTIVQFSKF